MHDGKCRCVNCPSRPVFETHQEFADHWKNTHTVPTSHTVMELMRLPDIVVALAPELANKRVELHEVVKE